MKGIIGFVLGILILVSNYNNLSGQIINGGFEEWEEAEGYIKPVGWQAGFGFANYLYEGLLRDTISAEGDFSLKFVSLDGLLSCKTHIRPENYIPTIGIGERVSIFMDYKSLSVSSTVPDITYFEVLGSVFKNDSIVATYHRLDTLEYEAFTEIEIPIEFSNPDSISLTIAGGAEPVAVGTGSDICIYPTHSWLDNIRIAPSTSTVETENFGLYPVEDGVEIFPNPSINDITIAQKTQKFDSLEVYDLYGRLILIKALNFPLDKIEDLEKGVYVIRLTGAKQENRRVRSEVVERVIIN